MPIDLSKFFDSIRIKPNKLSAKQQAQAREAAVLCEWPECKNKGPHRAPKGRANDKEYWHFCLNHVREYNQSYNFFSGHECGRGRALPEGCADRPSPDLENGRQHLLQERQGQPGGRSGRRRRSVQHVLRAQRPRPLAAGPGRAPRPRSKPGKFSTPSARRCR